MSTDAGATSFYLRKNERPLDRRPLFDAGLRSADKEFIHTRRIATTLLDARKVVIPQFPTPDTYYVDYYRSVEQHADVRDAVLSCLAKRYDGYWIDAVAGIGNGGLPLGACLALTLGVPFHP